MSTSDMAAPLAPRLRQMLAVLATERQALADMDVEVLLLASEEKQALCGELELTDHGTMDEETRGLVEAARHQNEVNRKVRNLLAANVSSRLDTLGHSAGLYTRPALRQASGSVV